MILTLYVSSTFTKTQLSEFMKISNARTPSKSTKIVNSNQLLFSNRKKNYVAFGKLLKMERSVAMVCNNMKVFKSSKNVFNKLPIKKS